MTYTFLEPYAFKNGLSLRNKILMAPMTTSSSSPEGDVTEEELMYYLVRSSGPGAVVTACAYISSEGQAFANGMSVAKDSHLNSLSKLANVIKLQGAKAILQIYHGGRMSRRQFNGSRQPVAPSPIRAERKWTETPKELTEGGISILISQFALAVKRAIDAGFDGVELHGGNTYLLQQFVSPHSNQRTDKWGGSLENRLRFPLEVIKACQDMIKQHADRPFLLGYRFSPEEIETPGIRLTDTYVLIDALSEQNIDYLHLSVNHYYQPSIVGFRDYHYQVPQLIGDYINERVPLISVGSIKHPDDAQKALSHSQLISLGRQLIIDPKWVQKVENGDLREIETALHLSKKHEYIVPAPLWIAITASRTWFPIRP